MTRTNNRTVITPWPVAGWLLLHLTIATGGLLWAAVSWEEIQSVKALPKPLRDPLVIRPLHDVPEIISDDELQYVLWKLRPRLRGPNPSINHVDHALRFWGVPAKFDDPNCYSGVEMRELLLDHRKFSTAWTQPGTRPLFLKYEKGIKPRLQQGDASTSHVDHTLGTLAEVGTPLDYPIVTSDGETDVRALLDQSLYEFSVNQLEYEWSILAYALYLPNAKHWVTQEGQKMSYDRMADRLLRQKLTQGVCFGNHRLFTLSMLLRVDERSRILSDEMRGKVVAHLQMVTATLIKTQDAEGYWDRDWDGSATTDSSGIRNPVSRRILATGHALEWWAMAPDEVLPPLDVRVAATRWLIDNVVNMSDREVELSYPFLSHAGRALSLWRGKFPYEVFPDRLCPSDVVRPTTLTDSTSDASTSATERNETEQK
ncbi:MAG: hypothetical protein O2955_02975 [Planctomycetota bacterium]|nr:hypothetical protein [Planctomycetota bacterium]MDA1211450.1 hypothetical protein [Planctomycetota bacterium]